MTTLNYFMYKELYRNHSAAIRRIGDCRIGKRRIFTVRVMRNTLTLILLMWRIG